MLANGVVSAPDSLDDGVDAKQLAHRPVLSVAVGDAVLELLVDDEYRFVAGHAPCGFGGQKAPLMWISQLRLKDLAGSVQRRTAHIPFL